jgi:ABC-type nitrate/sulfonate/bicarbonate transport system permease component
LWSATKAHYPACKAGHKACGDASANRLKSVATEDQSEETAGAMHDAATFDAPATVGSDRLRVVARNAFPFIVVGAIWEVVARAGVFPHQLFPTLEDIARSLVDLTVSGILPHHAIETVLRLLSGFGLAAVLGVGIGVLMGRSRRAEDIILPLVSILAPIPGLAYAPLFLLWFGPGEVSAVLLVAFVSMFPMIFNSWTGVKAVKEIWLRSAQAMGADDRRVFRHVIVPGALPYILTGLRLGLAQAWRILVAVEMLAAVPWGLGWLIFGAREFLNTDAMMAGIVVIALIGLGLEKLVFQKIEDYTVVRWGMMGSMG